MDNAKIKFKFVTPAILGGTDKQNAEVRIPAIRGQLIWWTKALGYGEDTINGIFGGISKDETGKDKPIASSYIFRDLTENLKINKGDGQKISGNKFDYFLWPLRNTRQDAQAGIRGYIETEQEIELSIKYRRNKNAIDFPESILKAFLYLGALGTRSRRCYGSIFPTSLEIDGVKEKIPKNIDEFKVSLNEILDEDANCRILQLEKGKTNWNNAVNSCADFLKMFRCGGGKFSSPLKWGKNDHDAGFGGKNEIYRPEIGLPLKTKYYEVDAGRDIDRLASPIHFKVLPLDDGFVPIAIFFKSHTLSNYTDTVKVRGQNINVSSDLFFEMMNPDEFWEGTTCLYE